MGKGKRTAEEQEIHRIAVDLRKLTDDQLVEKMQQDRDVAYKLGRLQAVEEFKELLKSTITPNDRLTHKRAQGSGYLSNHKKDELVAKLSEFEDLGIEPGRIREVVNKCVG